MWHHDKRNKNLKTTIHVVVEHLVCGQLIFSSLGLCPWRAYVVTQSLGSASRRPRPR